MGSTDASGTTLSLSPKLRFLRCPPQSKSCMWIEETRSGLSLQIARTIMSLRKLVVSSALAARRASPFSLSGARATYSSNILIHMGGTDQGEIFSDAHKAICGTGGEVKESRSVRLGGRFSQMFLVANVDEATVELALKDFGHGIDYLNVQAARQTTRDMKGPYCATSPLVPFVRHARLTVPWKRGVVNEGSCVGFPKSGRHTVCAAPFVTSTPVSLNGSTGTPRP